jgi:hypothetical protein
MSVKMNSAKPVRKVTAATIGSAVASILVWILNDYALPRPIPDTVVPEIVMLFTFLAGYLTPPGPEERVVAATPPSPGAVTP